MTTQTEALKLALEALEDRSSLMKWQEARDAVKEALAQPEQEPVVWMYQDKSTHEVRFQKHMRDFVDHGATYETPLYTTSPQRTWVGLTPDEIRGISLASGESLFSAIMFTHDKLKEKNT